MSAISSFSKQHQAAFSFLLLLKKKNCVEGSEKIADLMREWQLFPLDIMKRWTQEKSPEDKGRILLEALKQPRYRHLVPILEPLVDFEKLSDPLKGALAVLAYDCDTISRKIYPLMKEISLRWAIYFACQLQNKMEKISPSFSSKLIQPFLNHPCCTPNLASDTYEECVSTGSVEAMVTILQSPFGKGILTRKKP